MRPIAIVGLGGVFPGSPDIERFWDLIVRGRDASREVPPGRWGFDPERVYRPWPPAPDKVYSTRGYFIEDFVPDLSGLDPQVAAGLDPSHGLLVHAGTRAYFSCRTEMVDKARTAVVVGNIVLPTEAAAALSLAALDRIRPGRPRPGRPRPSRAGTVFSPLNRRAAGLPAGTLAQALGLGGGCFTLDAACSSSLFAVKLARDQLNSGRADLVLAGGLCRPDCLYTQMGFSQLRALSPSGRAAPFDASADGLVVGEGAGVIALKRLDDALAAGDRVWGLIRGVGLSNDRQGNLLAPQSEGQVRAMVAAYAAAGWDPGDVDLIECHATGTPVGDRVELESLRRLWGDRPAGGPGTVLGSVKANIGHLLTGSGAAGLIKVLLALEHRTLPPTANFKVPNPGLGLENSPFEVLAAARPWERRASGTPRRAAVSGFGFGGTNAHVLLEEYRPDEPRVFAVPASLEAGPVAIAVVGLDACFGPWPDLRSFRERSLGGKPGDRPAADRGGSVQWGQEDFDGFFIRDVKVPLGRFRIPPLEIKAMLPQQALMLTTAARAFDDAGFRPGDGERTGVFIGLDLDVNTTNFHYRWLEGDLARTWAGENGLSGEDADRLVADFQNAAGPALSADRTLGALGSIVAGRVAREFGAGGPCHTVSCEENSGPRALELGVRALQNREVDQVLVGAVDLCGDVRMLLLDRQELSGEAEAPVPGEGAAALVLRRLDDALAAGDKVYAVIKGLGAASGGAGDLAPALDSAFREAGLEAGGVDLVETTWSGGARDRAREASALVDYFSRFPAPSSPRVWGRAADGIGRVGAASGLAALVRAVLGLHDEMFPACRDPEKAPAALQGVFHIPCAPMFRIKNRAEGPRRTLVGSRGAGGDMIWAILEEPPARPAPARVEFTRPAGSLGEALFLLTGSSREDLGRSLDRLDVPAARISPGPAEPAARAHWAAPDSRPGPGLNLALLARTGEELRSLIGPARLRLEGRGPVPTPDERVFFEDRPLGNEGDLAFVFPGSGCHFPGLGRDLSRAWPEVFSRLHRENRFLARQFGAGEFWFGDKAAGEITDHRALIMAQVASGAAVSDIISCFGLRPRAIIGHSLGESAGLIASGTWTARDEMAERIAASTLFSLDLAGKCRAARRTWRLPADRPVDWVTGLVNAAPDRVREALAGLSKAYLLIVNTPRECVVGGDREDVDRLIARLGGYFVPAPGVTTVHCEVVRSVEGKYRDLHLFETTPPPDVRIYSAAWGRAYLPTPEAAADSILAQALDAMDFPRLIDQAYRDGARLFLEPGPGASCARMISVILEGRPHAAWAAHVSGRDPETTILRALARAWAHGVPVDLSPLYGEGVGGVAASADRPRARIDLPLGPDFSVPPRPPEKAPVPAAGPAPAGFPLPSPPAVSSPAVPLPAGSPPLGAAETLASLLAQAARGRRETVAAHDDYLRLVERTEQAFHDNFRFQGELLGAGAVIDHVPGPAPGPIPPAETPAETPAAPAPPLAQAPFLDRDQCLEFARGKIGPVLGEKFAEIDSFPSRVRLPDEPLMLVDRIMEIEGEPLSLKSGRLVTEHDVRPGAWYLDNGKMVAGVSIEAGQADLFLSAYLGADFKTRGRSVYRLLDAEVTFHSGLPRPGQVISYDIRIERFFRHGLTYLFRFDFDGTIDGAPLLTMRRGCAGFFSQAELDAGRGLTRADLEKKAAPGVLPPDWVELAPPFTRESLDDARLETLFSGDLAGCFGPAFANLPLTDPLTLPGGRLKLIDRVVELDMRGGRYGLGLIRTEMDIRPDDWFLTCHFVGDMVMPGTLMYECCLQSLRIFLLRLGWVGEKSAAACDPVPGTAGRLKCRGQVTPRTARAAYEIHVKELGFGPEPYALADGIMFADGRPIVDVEDMSVRLTGLSRDKLLGLWGHKPPALAPGQVFGPEQVLAFAEGRPSEAFGEPYRPFDEGRFIARLPRPPYSFIDRVVELKNARAFKLVAGSEALVECDVQPDAWYFKENRGVMPYAVLLEAALQPCGWLAAYSGAALTRDIDLCFRNLGGAATQTALVVPETGTLQTWVKMTKASASGDVIILHFDFSVRAASGPVYEGNTYFGFFSRAALADQQGLKEARLYHPGPGGDGASRPFPEGPSYPEGKIRMIDRITHLDPRGGPSGLGFIRGTKAIDPDAWFFKAHFYQDPVWPGSLGIEAFQQLLQVLGGERRRPGSLARFESAALNVRHSWVYRGQVVPTNREAAVEAMVTRIDDDQKLLVAAGTLSVDGLAIYQMNDFAVRLIE
ncbi:MAG: beta-ketoacyl synthase N-terminal-like domain-containing protein [Pseudomonadota bacterium]